MPFSRIDGSMVKKRRDESIAASNDDPNTRILLASLQVCHIVWAKVTSLPKLLPDTRLLNGDVNPLCEQSMKPPIHISMNVLVIVLQFLMFAPIGPTTYEPRFTRDATSKKDLLGFSADQWVGGSTRTTSSSTVDAPENFSSLQLQEVPPKPDQNTRLCRAPNGCTGVKEDHFRRVN